MKNSFKHQRTPWVNGIPPIFSPNSVMPAEEDDSLDDKDPLFYLSYNNRDVGLYGCDTTAVVLAQMLRFYILEGDHRDALAAIKQGGFTACMEYVRQHHDQLHKRSDPIDESKEDIAATLKRNNYSDAFIAKALLAF